MHTATLIQYLKNTLPAHSLPLVLASLRQDALVWQSLQEVVFLESFGNYLAERGSARLGDWSPARLALFALSQSGMATPITDKLPEELITQSVRNYQNLMQNPEKVNLAGAGSIALAMYARNQQGGSWAFLTGEIDQHASFPWDTVVACLVGMVEKPLALLSDLASHQPSPLRLKLAIHALLAHPAEPITRIDGLEAVTQGPQSYFPAQPLEMLDFLHTLNQQNQELAAAFCRKLNAEKSPASHLPISQPFHQTDILRETANTLLDMEISRLAGDQAKENVLLDKLCAMRQILTASLLAQTVVMRPMNAEDTPSKTHLQATWRQAIDLLKSMQSTAVIDPFKAGLAQTLLQAGRSGEAHTILTSGQQNFADDPYQLMPLIQSAQQNGNRQAAQQAGAHLAEIFSRSQQDTGYVSPHASVDPIEIVEQLSAIEMSDAAIRVLESALQKAPNQESWLSKLVDLQVSSGKYSQAAENMQILSGFHPENLNLRHDLARTYEAFQSWGAALDEWNTLVEESNYAIPSDALDDLHALAVCALKAGHPDPAIHASQRALSLKSDDGLAYTYLGKAHALQHDGMRGLEYLTQATQISPTLPEGWLALAELLCQQERYQQAIESLQTAIQIIPNNARLLFALGELQQRVGNSTMAVNALKQAVTLDPTQNRYHFTLGTALTCLGRTDEALAELDIAYQTEPENIVFAAALGSTLLDSGNSRAALQPLSIAIHSNQAESPHYLRRLRPSCA